jgi:hypothetical protein
MTQKQLFSNQICARCKKSISESEKEEHHIVPRYLIKNIESPIGKIIINNEEVITFASWKLDKKIFHRYCATL